MTDLVFDQHKKTEAVRLRRGLYIYKQPMSKGRGSPYWYARVYLDGRPIIRTMRTTDERLAAKRAEALLDDLRLERRLGASNFRHLTGRDSTSPHRFDRIADAWLNSRIREAGTDWRSLRRVRDDRQAITAVNGLGRFFGRKDVRTITTADIRDYLAFAAQNGKKEVLAPATKKKRLSTLSSILNHAYEKGIIAGVPLMPKVPQRDNPRAWFSQDEYRRLLIAAGKMVAEASDQDRQLFEELNDLIVFMVASLIRPSEWSRLRLRDVEIVDGAEPHVRVHVHHGKVRGRHAVSLPSAIPVVRRIAERLKEDRNGYLFLNQYPNRVTARDKMRSLFERLVKFAELEFDGEGKRRTAYSLRHTAIMLRLLEGDNIDLIVLAGNAGTGIQQIQRFYGSHLLPEMKLDNLLSMKRRQSFDPRLGELGVISPASQKSKVLFVQTST